MSEWIQTEVGRIPGHWRIQTASEFCLAVKDGTHDSPKQQEQGEFLVTSRHITEGKIDLSKAYRISREEFDKANRRSKVDMWDVLLTMIGTVGEVVLVKEDPSFAIKNIGLFKCGEEGKARWLTYFLKSPYGRSLVSTRQAGTTQEYITLDHLRNLPVFIPPGNDQRAIINVLSSLDDKIDLLHRQNKTLEALAETLFRQWFVEEAEENGKLGDAATCVRESIQPDDMSPETLYVGLEHIDRRNIVLTQCGKADKLASTKFVFAEDDILFGKLRPYFHKVCFAPFQGVCSTDILVIRPKEKRLLAFCLFTCFQKNVVDFSDISSEGTRMPRTSWEILKDYPIAVPEDEMVARFNAVAEPAIHKMKQNQNQIRTLTQLRDTLLPKLMSGEVRVKS